ncbi:right-handed parallel beta-helix repeat-containing protein [Peribacillus huizhouensis]|uniref:Lysophospholipase L1-like esterase n=1 Tax=Peribacillus huizhouensis TaxID=1501239 RepID=A0ABR6CR72_9BACI|nr:right-handed parallel beta-helix repeat-containing protein [Peribacillus huizhouensis]MBA9027527.1 lysophospholipase L1-like esterase [Peribacillus huizhouensis]
MSGYKYGNQVGGGDSGVDAVARAQVEETNRQLAETAQEVASIASIKYVSSVDGDDLNKGTLNSPWKTIQYAVDTAEAGDTIYVMNGTYKERVLIRKSGKPDRPIKLVNYKGHSPIIDGTGITWWSNSWQGLVNIENSNNWIFEGLKLINSYAMGFGQDWTDGKGSSNVIIRNCSVTDAGGSGIYFINADNILIDNCELKRVCKNLSQEGLSLVNVDNFEIKDCRVIDCYKEGIDLKDGTRNGIIHGCYVDNPVRIGIYVDAFSRHQYNIEVYNNTVTNVPEGVGLSTGVESGGTLEGIIFRNNIVYDSLRGYNIVANNNETGLPYKISDIVVRNNVAFNVSFTGVLVSVKIKNLTIENNILFSNQTSSGIQILDLGVTDINELAIRNNFFRDYNLSRADLPVGVDYKVLAQVAGADNAYDTVFKDATGVLTGERDFNLAPASAAKGAGHRRIDMGIYGKYPDGMSVTTQLELIKQARVVTDEIAYKPYNYIYNIDNGLRKWRLAKARLDSGVQEIINVCLEGDSNTEGQAGGAVTIDNYKRGYATLLRNQFTTKYGDVGEGMIANQYPYTAAVGRWTYTGTWQTFGGNGLTYGSSGTKIAVAAGSTASFTFKGTGVVVLLEGSWSSGSVDIAVDGGTAQTLSTSRSSDGVVIEHRVTGLVDGTHTVVLTTKSASKVSLLGAYELKGSKGVRINNFGVSGLKVGSVAKAFNSEACIGYWTPKLTIISFLSNDYNTQTSLDAFKADWQAVITKAKQYGDVLITTTGGIFNANHPIPMNDYYNIVLQLAKDYNCALVDIKKRWGSTYSVANAAGYLVDEVHPKPEGHQDIFNVLSKVLLEGM